MVWKSQLYINTIKLYVLELKLSQAIIERTFETIHNGPLQSLAKVLKLVRDKELPTERIASRTRKRTRKIKPRITGNL